MFAPKVQIGRAKKKTRKNSNNYTITYIQWTLHFPDGSRKRKVTYGSGLTTGELRTKAHEQAVIELRDFETIGDFNRDSTMIDYIKYEVIPAIKTLSDERLRSRTKARYLLCLSHLSTEFDENGVCEGLSIRQALLVSNLDKLFPTIASKHGSATAKQTKKVMSKYVIQRMVHDRIVDFNVLRDYEPNMGEFHVAKPKPCGGHGLSKSDWNMVLDHLLTLNPAATAENSGSKATIYKVATEQLLIDTTLTQASTGLRIGEIRNCRRSDIDLTNEPMTIRVREEISKTHRGRSAIVFDSRVAKRIRERLDNLDGDNSTLVFAPATAPKVIWDRSNAQKTLKKFYERLSKELNIPILSEVGTHVWRTTLNTITMEAGMPEIERAAQFGHTIEVNRSSYTDLTEMKALKRFALNTSIDMTGTSISEKK